MKKIMPVVVAFSFGSRDTMGNILISFAADLKARSLKSFTVITQKDIPSIKNSTPFFYMEDFMADYGWHSTLWVANAARKFCQHKKLPLIAVVVAARVHLSRAVRDVKKMGFEVVEEVPVQQVGYEKESSLPWTRSWWRWWSREIPLRLLPWWLYKRLTLK